MPGRADDIHATLDRADELAKSGKPEESNLLYREALKSDPECWGAYLGIGRNYFTAGEYENASAAFEQAAELQPSNPELFYWLGRSYIQQQQPDKIIELLGRANSTIANSAQAHILLARGSRRAGRNRRRQTRNCPGPEGRSRFPWGALRHGLH